MSWKQILKQDDHNQQHVLEYKATWGPYSPIGEFLKSKCGAQDNEECQDVICELQKWARPLEKLQCKFAEAIRAGPMGQPLDVLAEIEDYIDKNQTALSALVQKLWWRVNSRNSGPSAGYSWD